MKQTVHDKRFLKAIGVSFEEPTVDPQNPILEYMRKKGIPQTKQNYLALAFPTREPNAEELANIPEQFEDDEE